jgi:GH15 family glucan-1,4-alpha-glucosidase
VPVRVTLTPRFDYGLLKPWMRRCNGGTGVIALGGHQGLLFTGDIEIDDLESSGGRGSFTVAKGQRRYLAITYRLPHELDGEVVEIPDTEEIERRFQDTIKWWRNWSAQLTFAGPDKKQLLTSAIVLKGLTNAPTGAIAAAATTSLPESIGSSRNWDYRFSWVRDSVFSVTSLATLGFRKEADGFRRFVERTAAGEASELQVMFGVGGERYLPEHQISKLDGYRGSAPVRVGNAAAGQMQHDVFGELLHLAYIWHRWGNSPDDQYWNFILQIIDRTGRMWRLPDHGIWEIRGQARHYVYSKAMCWAAFDRAIRLAKETGREAPLHQWQAERHEIRKLIEERGYDRERGVYTQAFGFSDMDASLLLLPVFGFIPFDDDRMMRTTDLIRQELHREGLIMRYPEGADRLDGREGTFVCCTFWLAEVLAKQNRLEAARAAFAAGRATANDLGLFSEEFDARERLMLGNFPQGLSHLSMISAAIAIDEGVKASENSRYG